MPFGTELWGDGAIIAECGFYGSSDAACDAHSAEAHGQQIWGSDWIIAQCGFEGSTSTPNHGRPLGLPRPGKPFRVRNGRLSAALDFVS